MTSMPPLVLATSGTLPRFLYRPTMRGGEPQVLSDPTTQGYTLSPMPGMTRDFPSLATLLPIADLYRTKLAGNEWNPDARDAVGRTLNNVGAHQILTHQASEAIDTLADAEQQYIEIYKMYPGAARPLIGLATARYNIAVNDLLHGSHHDASEALAGARRTIDAVPTPDRDAGFDFFHRALREAQAQL